MVFKLTFVLIASALLIGCGVKKENSTKNISVVIQLYNAVPHCGGAAPLPEDEWPKMEELSGCELSVHEVNTDGSRGKQVATFTSNESGKGELVLPKGKYQLWAINKLEEFERFLELEGETKGVNYENRDETCFKAWYDKADFEFEVGDETDFEFAYKNRCFTGSHPCLIYSGPYPP